MKESYDFSRARRNPFARQLKVQATLRKNAGGRVNRLIAAAKWKEARALLSKVLRQFPDDHQFISAKALTYYEEYRYRVALKWSEKALRLAPSCPQVLLEYAGELDMLGRYDDALTVFRRVLGRGANRLAHGACTIKMSEAREAIRIAVFRIGNIHRKLGHIVPARRFLRRYIREVKGVKHPTYSTQYAKKRLALTFA